MFHQVGLPIPRDLASTRSNTYNQADKGYGNITPNHMYKQRKDILRAVTPIPDTIFGSYLFIVFLI